MSRRTYEKRQGRSLIFKTTFTEWTVRNSQGRKLGTIVAQEDGRFNVSSGHYDANDNFVSSSSGKVCDTYRQAQAWFRGCE